jgi:hypothetical protein
VKGAHKILAQPPRIVPKRRARKGSSDVTGPHFLSPANCMGMAARHLANVSNR